MIESGATVRGPFATQPLLVKVGCLVALAAFVVFGGFLATSVAVAVIAGVGRPAPHWTGTAGSLAFAAVFAAIGAWTNCRFLAWLRSGVLGFRAGCLLVGGTIVVSAMVASLAAMLGRWPEVFLSAVAVVMILLLVSHVLILVGQAVGNAT